MYIELHPEYTKSEKEWLNDLVCGKLNTEEYAPITGEFVFATNGSNTYYLKAYTGYDKFIAIPSTYNGYPVTEIDPPVVKGNSIITEIIIPDTITSIEDSTFSGCSNLKSVTIGDGITSIGDDAFRDCTSLTSINIPDSVTSIGEYAFRYCLSLTNVHVSDISAWCKISFDNYWSNPFYYAENLYLNGELVTDLVIPNGVTSIGNYTFRGCSSLTSVTIPDGVTNIGDDAFYYCLSLTSITIPDSVTSIGEWAFYYCSSLKTVYYTGTEAEWASISIDSNNDYLTNANIIYNYNPEE